jgi:hypothetical protein
LIFEHVKVKKMHNGGVGNKVFKEKCNVILAFGTLWRTKLL